MSLPYVIPRQGKGLPDTNVFTDFSAEQLDAIAPLEKGDSHEMGEFSCPSTEAIERMDERIKAAKRLKYGS
jgi:hypothetical protein